MRIEDRSQGRLDAPLPRFPLPEGEDQRGEPPRQTHRSSLAPMATDVLEDEPPKRVTPRQRKVRAAMLFAAIFTPVLALAVVELAMVGPGIVGEVAPAAQRSIGEAKSWGAGLMDGRAESRLEAPVRDAPITDDQARELAEASLEQALALARVTCGDEGMPATTFWVTTALAEDGDVVSVAVEGPTHGKPRVATCVGEMASQIHVPRFRGPPVTAMREVTIR